MLFRSFYTTYRGEGLTDEQALDRKRQLFAALGQACLNSGPAPVSFNRCPAVLNNAGLAFDRTYTRDYPAIFERAPRLDADVPETIASLRRALFDVRR